MALGGKGWKAQCTAKAKSTGLRCTRPPLVGLKVCRMHGGATMRSKGITERVKLEEKVKRELSRMERLTALIPENDPEARGDVALTNELRRTVNRIRILDEWIQELGDRSLGWGIVSREVKKQTGWSEKGDDSFDAKTFESRMNVYYAIQLEERKHLAQLAKIWISAGFKQRELDLQERQVLAFNQALIEVVTALGSDPSSPGVRSIVHRAMLGLSPRALESTVISTGGDILA